MDNISSDSAPQQDALGINKAIERRDVLIGIGAAAAAAVAPAPLRAAEPSRIYPPALTGLRGSTDAAFQYAHALRDGTQWDQSAQGEDSYDLVVVGAGISGLSAAYLFQKQFDRNARILILDNHDDFGGHARRNEYHYGGRTFLSPGGSVMVGSNQRGKELLSLIDFDVETLTQPREYDVRTGALGLKGAVHFDKRHYGVDRTIVGDILPLGRQDELGNFTLLPYLDDLPVSAAARASLLTFLKRRDDILPGASPTDIEAFLKGMSYDQFLIEKAGLTREAADIFARHPSATTAVTSDCIDAMKAMTKVGMPGLNLLGDWGVQRQAVLNAALKEPGFGRAGPEGNAIVVRSLILGLLPHACPAQSLATLENVPIDYSRLDMADQKVRLRLSSTVVHVEGGQSGREPVLLTYVRDGKLHKVRAAKCVLACYNMMIPYMMPSLPEEQKAALSYNVKVPVLAASVLLRTGEPFSRLGAASFYSPGRLLHEHFAWCRSFGTHRQEFSPADPAVMYMIAPPIEPHSGLSPREQYRAARADLVNRPFADFEFEIREHLEGLFAGTGFSAARDIIGLTLNRWGHGYSYELNPLFDGPFARGELPFEIARKPAGSVTIANSDAGMAPHAIDAVEQAARAVNELLSQA